MQNISSKELKANPIRSILLLTQPSAAILALLLVLMHWHIPMSVKLILRTELPQHAEIQAVSSEMQAGRIAPSQIRTLDIQYPMFPNMRSTRFTEVSTCVLEPVKQLGVKVLEHNSATHEVLWQLEGRARRFQIRAKGIRKDLRMTGFDLVINTAQLLYGLLSVWIVFTAFSWFRLYKELRRNT
ncbi:hypothetical protein CSB45_05850 [candidate division KSB3 bacterium]|uniref:Uncharacterized protein n=1 Tax=candidate division KSB3 bacterium TaxID=2044937 RepID=A0A2G6E742_9BACT|nr:MAG: hypothetical protein CSB45_05850 [candidate division KSB3 bacterium]PIE30171.1 MAG: hypothetical protein CSA57_04560 [candidate division KSB3 bacterium]